MKLYNFEIYICEPITGESGWEIAFINVYAETFEQAKEKLKSVPDFDCIILFNYSLEIEKDAEDVANYAAGHNYRFTMMNGESILSPYYFD